MRRRLLLAALAGLHLGSARAYAEEPPLVTTRPGAVTTVVVLFPAHQPDGAARFTTEPAEGVRILGATRGVLPATGAAPRRLPVTFTMPADAAAGEAVEGRVTLEWPDGTRSTSEIRVRVGAVHRLLLAVTASEPTIEPGGSARILYRITNQGNTADTVQVTALVGTPWTTSLRSESRVIATGAVVEGRFEVRAPRTTPAGEQRLVQLRAVGGGADERRSISLLVAEHTAELFGMAQIPVSVYLGGSSVGGAPNLSIAGHGTVGPETEVGLAFRRTGSYYGQTYGQTDLWGPQALLSVHRQGLRGEAGELSVPIQGIASGVPRSGTGGGIRAERGGLQGGVVVVRPRSGTSHALGSGHLVQADLGYALGLGTISARLVDFDRSAGSLVGATRLQLAALRYLIDARGPHRLSAEAGLLRQDAGPQSLSADASYSYTASRSSLSAHLRRVPEQSRAGMLNGNEASLAGRVAITSAVGVHGSAYWSSRPLAGPAPAERAQGATAGIQLSGFNSALGLSLNRREHEGRITLGEVERRTSVAASLSTAAGPLALRANAESGLGDPGKSSSDPSRRLQGQLRWSRPSRSVWWSVSYTSAALFSSPLQTELGTRLRLGVVNLDAVAGASMSGATPRPAYLKAAVESYMSRTLSLVAGTEYRPWAAGSSAWTFSFGARKTLSLPLPLRQAPPLAGTVFEDRNGNGRHDRGEPGLAGAVVSIGSLEATTDAAGSFSFRYTVPAGLPVQLHAETLPREYLVLSSETLVPGSGRIEVPVVRAAALDLLLFEDRDGDGARTAGEETLPGVVVVARGPQGRSYPRLTDAGGRASFSALPSGAYEITAQRDGQAVPVGKLELSPGAHLSKPVALSAGGRRVRMWGGDAAPSPTGR